MTLSNRPTLGMILKGFPRISETFISNEILQLEKQGFSVHIFSMRHPREDFTHRSVRQIKASVDYLPQTLLVPLPRLLWHNGCLFLRKRKAYLRALKMAWRRFKRTRKSATIKHLLQGGYLVNNLLPGSGVVHLHAHFAHSPTSVALFTSLLSGLPFSFTAHAKDIYTSDPRQLREKLRLSRFAVTCTEYNRRHLQALSGNGTCPIHRIYHGIDVKLFTPSPPPGEAPNPTAPYRLLTVARMTPKKGLKTVYQMVNTLLERGVEVSHTLIGDGEQRDEVGQMIDTMGLGAVARWRGTLPHEAVLKAFAEADLFVLGCEVAANGDRDGIPNVIVESLAMGCPVVATDISALPEIVINGETGLLVPPRRPDLMADAALRLLTDAALRQSVITRGRRHVDAHFDNRVLVGELGALLRREIPALAST